jgi:hypothetical protein
MNEDIKKEPETNEGEHKKANFKKLKYGTMSIVLSIAVIAVIVLLNVILTLASNRVQLAADLTTTKFYELSETTTDYLDTVTSKVNIVVMAEESVLNNSGEQYFKQALEMIKNYAKENNNITVEFVNLTANPQYASRYAQIYQGNIGDGDVVISSDTRITVFPFVDMFNIGYNDYGQQVISSSKVEQSVTSAVMYVTNKNPKKVYVMDVPTADESNVAQNVGSLLGNNGYDVLEWNPIVQPAIPTDADVLVITAPLSDFDETMINTFTAFLENGGKWSKNIIYLAHPGQTDTTNINSFLYDWGVGVDNTGFISDTDPANLASTDSIFALRTYINTADNSFLAGVPNTAQPVIINRAMPIKFVGAGETGDTSVVTLLSTALSSYVINEELLAAVGTDPNFEYPTAAYPVMTVSQKGYKSDYEGVNFSNVLVISSSDMLVSGLTGATYYNNGSYFVSILNEMTGRSDTITIIPKTSGTLTFAPDVKTLEDLTVVFYYVLPLAVAVIAAVVILRRRHK